MKRNVYLVVDVNQNAIIGSECMASDKAIIQTVSNALQKQNIDVEVKVFSVGSVNLNDDNEIVIIDSDTRLVWSYPQDVVSDSVKSDVLDSSEV